MLPAQEEAYRDSSVDLGSSADSDSGAESIIGTGQTDEDSRPAIAMGASKRVRHL